MSLSISLLDAVKESDIDLVKELLQHDVDVNCMDEVSCQNIMSISNFKFKKCYSYFLTVLVLFMYFFLGHKNYMY